MKCDNCGTEFVIRGSEEFELKPPGTNGERKADPQAWTKAFQHFYEAYPRKVALQDARKAWKALQPKNRGAYQQKFQTILLILEERKRNDWYQREPKAIPYPATFLRDEAF